MIEEPFATVGMKIYKHDLVPLFQRDHDDDTLIPIWMMRIDGALYVNPAIWDVVMAFWSKPIDEQNHGEPMWHVMGRGDLAAAAMRNLAAAYRPEGLA